MPAPARRLSPMLSAADVATSIAFYRDLLGGSVIYGFPEDAAVFVPLAIGESEVGIGGVTESPLHRRPQRPAGGHRVELCVYVEDVDKMVTAARAAGVPVLLEPVDQPLGERVVYVEDPDRNLVMLTAGSA